MKFTKRLSLLPLILLFVLQVSAATYVASINSDVYHISSCGQAEKIKSKNLITFQSADAAEASGRHPCSFCRSKISQSRKSDAGSNSSAKQSSSSASSLPSKIKSEVLLIEKTAIEFLSDAQNLLNGAASDDEFVKIKTSTGYAVLISEEQWNLLVEALNLSVKTEK